MISVRTEAPPRNYSVKMTEPVNINGIKYSSPSAKGDEWDICYKYDYPFNVLCNFTSSRFIFDGVEINSMEGFLQSLKVKDPGAQEKMCKMPGFLAKKAGNYLKKSGQFDREHLYWRGKEYKINSKEYQALLNSAYRAKYLCDTNFRNVLAMSEGYTLTHKIGKSDPADTVLTEEEFINNLNLLRDKETVGLSDVIAAEICKGIHRKTNPMIVQKNLKGVRTTFVNDRFICGDSLFTPENNKYITPRSGIKNIIDLDASSDKEAAREKFCRERGINYVNVLTPSKNVQPEKMTDCVSKLVSMYNSGDFSYICSKERKDANLALALNYLYNPDATLPDAVLFGTPRKLFVAKMRYPLINMTESDKTSLNWNREFEEEFPKRQKVLLELNG